MAGGNLASWRVESLLHAADPELPLVHGLVDGSAALAYWEAVERAGVTAGPLHLLGPTVGPDELAECGPFPEAWWCGADRVSVRSAPNVRQEARASETHAPQVVPACWMLSPLLPMATWVAMRRKSFITPNMLLLDGRRA